MSSVFSFWMNGFPNWLCKNNATIWFVQRTFFHKWIDICCHFRNWLTRFYPPLDLHLLCVSFMPSNDPSLCGCYFSESWQRPVISIGLFDLAPANVSPGLHCYWIFPSSPPSPRWQRQPESQHGTARLPTPLRSSIHRGHPLASCEDIAPSIRQQPTAVAQQRVLKHCCRRCQYTPTQEEYHATRSIYRVCVPFS